MRALLAGFRRGLWCGDRGRYCGRRGLMAHTPRRPHLPFERRARAACELQDVRARESVTGTTRAHQTGCSQLRGVTNLNTPFGRGQKPPQRAAVGGNWKHRRAGGEGDKACGIPLGVRRRTRVFGTRTRTLRMEEAAEGPAKRSKALDLDLAVYLVGRVSRRGRT